jgi:hypothetical protein
MKQVPCLAPWLVFSYADGRIHTVRRNERDTENDTHVSRVVPEFHQDHRRPFSIIIIDGGFPFAGRVTGETSPQVPGPPFLCLDSSAAEATSLQGTECQSDRPITGSRSHAPSEKNNDGGNTVRAETRGRVMYEEDWDERVPCGVES